MASSETSRLSANEAVVRSAFDALNRGDLGALRRLWHEEVVVELPGKVLQGPDAALAHLRAALESTPGLRVEPLVIACEDHHVLVRWRALAPGGLELRGASTLTFERGLVRRDEVLYDRAALGQGVGLLPAARTLAEETLGTAARALGALRRR